MRRLTCYYRECVLGSRVCRGTVCSSFPRTFTQDRCALHSHDDVCCARRDLRQNNISGALPEQWAQPPAMPDLTDLNLAGNQLSGSLPTSWGVPGSFLQLINLCAATPTSIRMLDACFSAHHASCLVTAESDPGCASLSVCTFDLSKLCGSVWYGHVPCLVLWHQALGDFPLFWSRVRPYMPANHMKSQHPSARLTFQNLC